MIRPAPALFIGHGSPMNALEDTPASRGWRAIAEAFPRPRAIVCVSAHWTTEGVRVTSNAKPPTIHDFGNFPRELHEMQYPAPGDPLLAADIVARLSMFGALADEGWGLDHGTWSVLVHMYPEADVPVLQVSLDARRGPGEHIEIGRKLGELRDEGVLVMASGNIVHNLRAFFGRGAMSGPWEREFDDFVVDAALKGDESAIANYRTHAGAARSAPDWDHFFPLLHAVGARREGEPAFAFNRAFAPGISMTSIAYGVEGRA